MREKSSVKVLVYSDDATMREQIIRSIGNSVADDLPSIEYIEAATWQGADVHVQEEHIDFMILDAEAPKLGGIGFGKKVRDEYVPDMPYLIVVARPQDEWLARTAKPNAVIVQPIKPAEIVEAVRSIMRAL